MIKGFENITKPLTEDELALVQRLISGFKFQVGKENAIKSREIVRRLSEKGYKITDVRLRKLINHIRTNGLAPICSNSKGYWYSTNLNEVKEEIESLKQRSRGIESAAQGLYKYMTNLTTGQQTKLI